MFRFLMLWVVLPCALSMLVLLALALRQAWSAQASVSARRPE